jgi:predicted esterase
MKRDVIRRATFAAALALASFAGAAHAASLYTGPGSRPGPDILYAKPAVAPQLQNAPGGPWAAAPLLVSGASAYRRGEFLYQDFLYDDHGARTGPVADPAAASDAASQAFSLPNGNYTYPTAAAYAGNAADFVELRAKPLASSTAFRITMQSMKDPSLIGISIALGSPASAAHAFPAGANVKAPADYFLTIHPGSGSALAADLVKADGTPAGGGSTATVDVARRQIDVRVPHSAWNPGTSVVRMSAGVGLWDKAAGKYLLPGASASATMPGGAGLNLAPAAFFNVAFRSAEPGPDFSAPTGSSTSLTDPRWWRDKAQGAALAAGDISPFHADVDFAKLAAKKTDDSAIPTAGPIDRIYASHYEPFQGVSFAKTCLGTSVVGSGGADCQGEFGNQLQPYTIYVPHKPRPAAGYGLVLLMHSLGANYNQFTDSRNQSQFGERGAGSVVITSLARGPDGGYDGLPAADVFEMWSQVARTYALNPDQTVIAGYSMGGLGTFKIGERFPDLFSRAQPTVGADTSPKLPENLRNLPVLMWNASTDELVGPELYAPTALALANLGYRYELDVFAPAEHLTLAINDQYAPAAAFLGTENVDRNPPHVTFSVDRGVDYAKYAYVSDHAYWVSGVKPRSGAKASVDVLSHAFGEGDPKPSGVKEGVGTLTGGTIPTIGYSSSSQTWGPVPKIPVADTLDVKVRNVATVTIDHRRARVSCKPKINLDSDGPVKIVLAGCEKPQIRHLKLTRTRFRPGKTGTTLSYSNTAAGRTTFTVRRKTGRTLHVVGSFAHTDIIGANRVRFTGRLHGKRLAPGLYRVYARTKADAGFSGTITRYFTILK